MEPTARTIVAKKGDKVFHVPVTASVFDAAKMMNENHVGAVVVTDGKRVVGIFTERDVLDKIVACQCDPANIPVKDVMTSPVAVCSLDTTIAECRNVMHDRRIRHLPVVENEQLVGIISIGDIVVDSEATQKETIRYLYEYLYGHADAGDHSTA